MAFYFFQTSEQLRDGIMKPTLRALPGQTLPDGTPIRTDLNVQAPKTPGESINGNRLDYPLGSIFCSTKINLVTTPNGVEYYSVYDQSIPNQKNPEFHPVSMDPTFPYVVPTHKNDTMNAAFALFDAGIDPNGGAAPAKPSKSKKKVAKPVRTAVADKNGIASPENTNWQEKYEGQLEEGRSLFGDWMRRLFSEKNVTLPNKILMGSVAGTFESLHRMGETLDTLVSRKRFETFLKSEKITYGDFTALVGTGPHKKYLAWIYKEHESQAICTAVERDPDDKMELLDASRLVCHSHNAITGRLSASDGKDALNSLKTALKAGWTVDDLLEPERMKLADSYPEYVQKLADGTIPLPQEKIAPESTLLERIVADKTLARPKDKDGFHVDEETWNVLMVNLKSRCNTMLVGPSGCGKTEVIIQMCSKANVPFTIIQMGTITDPTEQLVGQQRLRVDDTGHDEIYFDWADFALAIQKPGVVILDEINRMPGNGENLLFNILDGVSELSAHGAGSNEKRQIKVHPECVFFATANIGSMFTGTKQIDAALKTRFMPVEVGYLTVAEETKILKYRTGIEEDDAKNIAFVANSIRDMYNKETVSDVVSTRETLRCANLVAHGFTCLKAMELCFLPLFEDGYGESDRSKVKKTIMARFKNV